MNILAKSEFSISALTTGGTSKTRAFRAMRAYEFVTNTPLIIGRVVEDGVDDLALVRSVRPLGLHSGGSNLVYSVAYLRSSLRLFYWI